MNWEEIILKGLETDKDLSEVVAKAAEAAPSKVKKVLKDFESCYAENQITRKEPVLQLLHLHLLSLRDQSSDSSINQSNRENAAETLLSAADLAFTLNEKNLGIRYLLKAGNSFQNLEQFSKAEDVYTRALNICGEMTAPEDAPNAAVVLIDVGALFWRKKDFKKAEDAYTRAFTIFKMMEVDSPFHMAALLHNLGTLYMDMNNFQKAEKALKEALTTYRILAKKNRDHVPDVPKVLTTLGALYQKMGDFQKGEKVFQEAVTIRRALAETSLSSAADLASTLNNLGNLWADMNAFQKGEKVFQEAVTILKGLAQKDPHYTPRLALTLVNAGLFYADTSRFSEAVAALKEGLSHYRAVRSSPAYAPLYAAAVLNLGSVYWHSGEFRKAEKIFKKALNLYRTLEVANPSSAVQVAAALNNLGNSYWETHQLDKAEKAYVMALEKYRALAEKSPNVYLPYVAGTLHNLGTVYSEKKDITRAKKAFDEAITLREQRALWIELAETCHKGSPIYDRMEDAVRLLEMGILFSGEKKYIYAQKGRREEIYLDFLKSTDDPGRMVSILEALRDPDTVSLEWDSKKLGKVAKNKKLQKALVKKLLKQKIPPKIPSLVMDNALFLYMQKVEKILYVAVTKEEIKICKGTSDFAQIGEKLLANLRMQMFGETHKKDTCDIVAKFHQYAATWTHALPPAIQELLSEKEIVIFSPDAPCSYFPLEGLLVNGEPICLSKAVVRATSMNLLQNIPKKVIRDSWLIVGNPWPSSNEKSFSYHPHVGPLFYLEQAEKEARSLGKKLPKSRVFTGESATADEFVKELPYYSIIHSIISRFFFKKIIRSMLWSQVVCNGYL